MLPASPIRAKLAAMREIRKETRNPEKLQVLLSQMAEPLLAESGSTDNVSSHGMRVRTHRLWTRGSHLIVQSSEGELWGRAKVVYCQTLPANTFALGIEFVARTGGWIIRSSVPGPVGQRSRLLRRLSRFSPAEQSERYAKQARGETA